MNWSKATSGQPPDNRSWREGPPVLQDDVRTRELTFPRLGVQFPSLPPVAVGASVPVVPKPWSVRPPLDFRTAVLHPPTPGPSAVAIRQIPAVELQSEADYYDFPFLTDPDTQVYLSRKGTKLMLLFRGAPGSGKSTLRAKIISLLDNTSVRTASADHFWVQPNGQYVFDRERLSEAHEACRMECEKWCSKDDAGIVIVDNTNITMWEMSPYLRMAHRYGLFTLLIEPRTPWRYDVQELARRNIHDVPAESIERKVHDLQRFISPVYYGWFFNPVDSVELFLLAAKLTASLLHVEELAAVVDANPAVLSNRFAHTAFTEVENGWKNGKDLLHCTCFFTNRGRVPGTMEYNFRDDVQANLGRKHDILVWGLLVTPATISFRVQLSEKQLLLWNNDYEDDIFVRGAKAHITVTTAEGVPAYVAGQEMLNLGKTRVSEIVSSGLTIGNVLVAYLRQQHEPSSTTSVLSGEVSILCDGYCYLELSKPFSVPALFAPFYSRDYRDARVSRESTEKPNSGRQEEDLSSPLSNDLILSNSDSSSGSQQQPSSNAESNDHPSSSSFTSAA